MFSAQIRAVLWKYRTYLLIWFCAECSANFEVVLYACAYNSFLILTLCHSYLKPYCMGRKTTFFFSGHLIYILQGGAETIRQF
jgi:hypothetical protein